MSDSQTQPPPPSPAIKILIVDDSPSDRTIYRRFLEQSSGTSYSFSEAETLDQAYKIIENSEINCVLLDYDLPGGNGNELIEKVCRTYGKNHLPVVMLSGSGSLEIAVEAMRRGAHDYLVKGRAAPADLVRAVHNAIDKVDLYREKALSAEKIQISEERYRLLFDNTPMPAMVFDRKTLAILAVNGFAVKHYGYSREEFAGITLRDLSAPDCRSGEIVAGDLCGEQEAPARVSARHRKKDGTVMDVEINCHDITFKGCAARFVIIQDITERKHAENKIRESDVLNRTIIESNPDCVKLLDKNGKLQFMNGNGLCLMEIDDFKEFENRNWCDLWAEESSETVRQTLENARQGETGRFEAFCPTAKGTPKWWDVIVTPIHDNDGNVERILSVSRDITENKQIERERERNLVREKELREEAEAANRSKDEFLAVLSHELRTPLNAMYGWVQVLQKRTLDDAKKERAIQVIERNVRQQNALIDDLLDVSRIISGKIKIEAVQIDFCKIVSDALAAAKFGAEAKNITISSNFRTESCKGMGDSFRLQQVISNLLTNAIKFTSEGGSITVDVEADESIFRVSISDSGIGIDAELLPHVFERFKQADGSTKRKFGGLGLGLAIAKSLVEMHNGKITAESGGLDKGAIFRIELPVLQNTPKPSENHIGRNTNGSGEISQALKGLKIILVDDQVDSLELLSFILTTGGAEVYPFSNALSALDSIEKTGADLLISDISMPEVDGYDLIQRVRKLPSAKNRFLPAIAITAYASLEERAAVLSAGFQMHIAKPFDTEEIPHRILELLDSKY